jgi:hypothetical protein
MPLIESGQLSMSSTRNEYGREQHSLFLSKKQFFRIDLQFVKNEVIKAGFKPGCLEITLSQTTIISSLEELLSDFEKALIRLEQAESFKLTADMKNNARINGLVSGLIIK